MVIGAATEVIAGEGRIVTAGGIDSHIHFICPQLVDEALGAGLTTLIGGGTGPATGTNATTCTPGAWNIHRMLEAAEALPDQPGLSRQGQCLARPSRCASRSRRAPSGSSCTRTGARRRRPSTAASRVAEETDVQVAIHTDTLNEAGFVEDSIRAFKGRTIHTYHTEGAGGGHAPDIIRVCGEANCLPVLHQPDDAVHGEHHGRAPRHADGVPPPERRRSPRTWPSRSRASAPRRSPPRTCCTTSGAISMMSSDSQAMGRIGEVIIAHLADGGQDEAPARRAARRRPRTTTRASSATWPSTRSIRPSPTASRTRWARSRSGKLADLVLWKPAFFGVKPEMVRQGRPDRVAAAMGDPNASIPTPQPVLYRPMFAAYGRARGVHLADVRLARRRWRTACRAASACGKPGGAVRGCRGLGKARHDPQRATCRAWRSTRRRTRCAPTASSSPASPPRVLPMAQRYFLF